MSTATKRVPLIDLPIGQTRGLGSLEVQRQGKTCALPLAGVDISANVADRVASVSVKQTFKNTYTEHLEAVYIFPLSGGCVVSDFEMRVGNRVVKGEVQERAQARIQYQKALQEGKRAALLEQERDDVFTVQVGNIPPNEEITVTLTYSERLPFFEDGKTELRLPLVVAPRYIGGEDLSRPSVGGGTGSDTNRVPDASRITPPMLAPGFDPQVGLSIQVQLAATDNSGSQGVSELSCSQHATQLGIDADGVKIELARENERLNRDFVLQWRLATSAVRSSMLVYKKADGTSYAMLNITPPKRDGYIGAPRDVVFVLDRSGSMGGQKMSSAARACAILLQTLGPNDRFAIQAFDNVVEWLALPRLHGWDARWVDADEPGVERGEKFLRAIDARGGTELGMALTEAFSAVSNRNSSQGRVPVVVVLTDGEVGDESHVLQNIQHGLGEARLFTVGIDTTPNSGLMRRMANLGGGTCAFVQPGTSLENALRSVGREIGTPMITDLEVIGDGGAMETGTLTPLHLPDLFEGRAVTGFFQLTGKGSFRVKGKWADGKPFEEKVKSHSVKVPAIAQLWAKSMITDIEDQFRAQPADALRKKIIELSVQHGVLTKFTAFVAVDHAEVVNKDGTVREVVQPVEQPEGWDMLCDAAQPQAMMAQSLTRMRYGAAPAAPASCAEGGAADAWASSTGSFGAGPTGGGGWGAPPPPSAPMPQPQQQSQRQQSQDWEAADDELSAPRAPGSAKGGLNLGDMLNGLTGKLKKAGEPVERISELARKQAPRRDESALLAASAQLKKFAELLRTMFELIQKKSLPSAVELANLEQARKELLEALNQKTECGSQVPLLQKFLRGAAVELIESLKQPNGTAAGIQPIWERHMPAFERAQAEATTSLSTPGSSGDDRFWEASV